MIFILFIILLVVVVFSLFFIIIITIKYIYKIIIIIKICIVENIHNFKYALNCKQTHTRTPPHTKKDILIKQERNTDRHLHRQPNNSR